MKRTRRILNIIAIILVLLQLMGYWGNAGKKPPNLDGTNKIAWYIGYNLVLILAFVLFIISLVLKKKIEKNEAAALIDSIGEDTGKPASS